MGCFPETRTDSESSSLRKQSTSLPATIGFLAKWRPRSDCRNSILMTCQILVVLLIEANSPCVLLVTRPIRSTLPRSRLETSSVRNFM